MSVSMDDDTGRAVLQLTCDVISHLKLTQFQRKLARPWAEALVNAAREFDRPDLASTLLRLYGSGPQQHCGIKLKRPSREFILLKNGGGIMVRALVPRRKKGLRLLAEPTYWFVVQDEEALFYFKGEQAERDYHGLTGQDALNALAIDALRAL